MSDIGLLCPDKLGYDIVTLVYRFRGVFGGFRKLSRDGYVTVDGTVGFAAGKRFCFY